MVALKTERQVYMWHLTPQAVPTEAPVTVTLDEILKIWIDEHKLGKAEIYLDNDGRVIKEDDSLTARDPKNRVYIADIAVESESITLLINRGDPNVSEPAYIDSVTKDVRTVAPKKNESQGWSAHLVISKQHSHSAAYRACFERMPHANSWYAEKLLNVILSRRSKADSKYFYKAPVKKGKKTTTEDKPYKPAISVKKFPSDLIKEDIEKGELTEITLIKSSNKFSGVDAPDIVDSVKMKLVVKPKKVEKKRMLGFIHRLTDWARENKYSEIQIQIRNLPGNTSISPRFSLDQKDATETLYVRSQRLAGFKTLLESCYANIAPEIGRKMLDLINDDDKW